MNLGMRPHNHELLKHVSTMIQDDIAPLEEEYHKEVEKGDRWSFTDRQTEILEGLKAKAKAASLWNFWSELHGAQLSAVEYAYFAEEMGKTPLAAEVFNCSAPDTGNMEVLSRFGSEQMKKDWLVPLLEGKIRSAYLMTEPNIASSDATNIAMSCVLDDDHHYVLNGDKYWASGAGDPRCKVFIVMVRTADHDAPKHQRHSMILVPSNTRGIEILRPMLVFGHDDAPHGHMHIRFTDVRVPVENMIGGEGHGFKIAQSRLGPGRIHHCMRSIGQAEVALKLMCRRSLEKVAFGSSLSKLGANYDIIAECRMDIEMARLLCLKAAWMIDKGDTRAAAPYISQIKVVAPRVALKVLDESMQLHGGQGISQDLPLAKAWTWQRALRFADGPDAVHRRQVARAELRKFTQGPV